MKCFVSKYANFANLECLLRVSIASLLFKNLFQLYSVKNLTSTMHSLKAIPGKATTRVTNFSMRAKTTEKTFLLLLVSKEFGLGFNPAQVRAHDYDKYS